jgi:hypothetical protein
LKTWKHGNLETLQLENFKTWKFYRSFSFSSCLFQFFSFSSPLIPISSNFLHSIGIYFSLFFIFFSDFRNLVDPRFA